MTRLRYALEDATFTIDGIELEGPTVELPLDPHTHARTEDPDTSHTAARRRSDQTALLHALLRPFTREPLTCEQAANRAGIDPERASKRVSDLVRLGLLEDTDDRRTGSSGRPQIVRRITTAGRG